MTISTSQLVVHTVIALALMGVGLVLILTGKVSTGEGVALISAGAGLGGVGTLAATATGNPGSSGG